MHSSSDKAECSLLFQEFLKANSEGRAERTLTELRTEHIEPLVRRILSREGLLEDLFGLVVARLIDRLRAERTPTGLKPIQDLGSYVVVVTHLAIDTHLRMHLPERARLKNRLRYLFRNAPDLAIWEEKGGLFCGKSIWQDEGRKPIVLAAADLPVQIHGEDLRSTCQQLLDHLNGPVALEDLTQAIAVAQGFMEPREEATLETVKADFLLERYLQQRGFLEYLWQEIRLLPVRQAAALLLNLRDTNGRGVIELLPALSIASKAQIAEAMGWGEGKIESIWEDLPIDDNRIADLLGVTRQQVINLRKVGRERLERRLRAWEEGA